MIDFSPIKYIPGGLFFRLFAVGFCFLAALYLFKLLFVQFVLRFQRWRLISQSYHIRSLCRQIVGKGKQSCLILSSYGPNPASFLFSFHPFLNTMTYTSGIKSTINGKRVDGVLGIRTLDHEMESADEATDLWQLAYSLSLPNQQKLKLGRSF